MSFTHHELSAGRSGLLLYICFLRMRGQPFFHGDSVQAGSVLVSHEGSKRHVCTDGDLMHRVSDHVVPDTDEIGWQKWNGG